MKKVYHEKRRFTGFLMFCRTYFTSGMSDRIFMGWDGSERINYERNERIKSLVQVFLIHKTTTTTMH